MTSKSRAFCEAQVYGTAIVLAVAISTALATDVLAQSGTFSVFGPEEYTRSTGKPVVVSKSFSVLDPDTTYTLRVVGHDMSGLSGKRLTSAVVRLNGKLVLAPGDFRERGRRHASPPLEIPVVLLNDNLLALELRGAPGSGMTIQIIGIDNDPPTIVATADPGPNAHGWNNAAVTVRFECVDATSGIASCPDPIVVSAEGAGQIVTGTAVDNAGNSASASVILNIDRTPPDLAVSVPDDAACDPQVTLSGTAADSLSGIAELICNGAPRPLDGASYTCDVHLSEGQNSISVAARDLAGNVAHENVELDFTDAALDLIYVDEFELRWWDKGSGAFVDGAFYRPIAPEGYRALGHYGQGDFGVPRGFMFAARELEPGALAAPTGYQEIWRDVGSGADLDGSMWQPLCPEGYASLGVVTQHGYSQPATDEVSCVRQDLVLPGKVGNQIYNDRGSGGDQDIGAWQIVPDDDDGIFIGTFTAIRNLFAVPTGNVFVIDANAVKKSYQGCTSHAPGPEQIDQMVQDFGPIIRIHPLERYLMDDPEHTLDTVTDLTWGIADNTGDFATITVDVRGREATSAATLMRDVADLVDADLAHLIEINQGDFNEDRHKHWLFFNLGQRYDDPNMIFQEKTQPPFLSSCDPCDGLAPSSGDMSRAKAFVHVRQWNHLFTELQFWFFYPYNGPGKFSVDVGVFQFAYVELITRGRHYGDWEQVTLRIVNDPRQLAAINLSRHDFAEWVTSTQFGSRIQFAGGHPIVYSARDSHAHYPNTGDLFGNHEYKRVAHTSFGFGHVDVDLIDLTADGGPEFESFRPGSYVIVATEAVFDEEGNLQQRVVDPEWLDFKGRWGQYERLTYTFDATVYDKTDEEVGAGPSGPPQKGVWKTGPSSQKFWWTRNLETDEICHDGIDNDGDGWKDETDADCHQTEPASRLSGQCAGFPFGLIDDPRAGTTCQKKCFEQWSNAGWTDC